MTFKLNILVNNSGQIPAGAMISTIVKILIKANISGKRKRTGAEKQDGERACKVQDVFTGGCSTVCCRLVAEGHP